MIPTVEDILKMLLARQCTHEQAMAWMEEHFASAIEQGERQSLSQEAVRDEVVREIINELAAIADACVDLQQNRRRPDSDPVMGWDNALLTLGTLRKARALKREPNNVLAPGERKPGEGSQMSRPAAPMSETPETDALWNDPAMEADHIWALTRSLERRLSLAQTEIKGHMRVVDELKLRIAELEKELRGLKSVAS